MAINQSPVILSALPKRVEESILKTWKFHTITAPGVLIGCIMVETVIDLLKFPQDGVKYNAISETRVCLVDCIQVITGCTLGNKYLKLKETFTIGRYALAIYNRKTGEGIRAFIDLQKIKKESTPYLFRFFRRQRDRKTRESKRKEDGIEAMKEFIQHHKEIIGIQNVKINFPAKDPIEEAAICKTCHESFLIQETTDPDTENCSFCNGKVTYYTIQD